MSEKASLQDRLFQQIKVNLSPNLSLVSEVTDVLGVSTDSAYRRIRGETELTLTEAVKLASRFQIPLDTLDGMDGSSVTFQYAANSGSFNLERFMTGLENDLNQIGKLVEPEVTFFSREIPFFNYFQFPELAGFKFFVWQKMILGLEEMDGVKFKLTETDPSLQEKGQRILSRYVRIPTIEIWNEDGLRTSMQQILFFLESGYFADPNDAFILIDRFADLAEHARQQANKGFKFVHGTDPGGDPDNFQLYYNEAILPQNIVFIKTQGRSSVFLDHNILSYFRTTNPQFCMHTYSLIEEVMKKSQLISRVAEKDRNRFFNRLVNPITKARERAKRIH